MTYINEMNLKFSALSENESFARLAVASFCSDKIKEIEKISDIKTAVSEAVTNCIVHGYEYLNGIIEINCKIDTDKVIIQIIDFGKGIEDVDKALVPFYTSKPEMERSGMGFTVMESFMDKIKVDSKVDEGTCITMVKKLDIYYVL
jgi:stage II sporulation protein AB (anti-sigma F factor)